MLNGKYFDVHELADAFGIKLVTIYSWVRDDYLPHFRYKNLILVSEEMLLEFLVKTKRQIDPDFAKRVNLPL